MAPALRLIDEDDRLSDPGGILSPDIPTPARIIRAYKLRQQLQTPRECGLAGVYFCAGQRPVQKILRVLLDLAHQYKRRDLLGSCNDDRGAMGGSDAVFDSSGSFDRCRGDHCRGSRYPERQHHNARLSQSGAIDDPTDSFLAGICEGTIDGLAYEASMLKLSSAPAPHAEVFCVPKETKIDQQIRVVVKYIEARPERMHERFALLAPLALIEAWPCKS